MIRKSKSASVLVLLAFLGAVLVGVSAASLDSRKSVMVASTERRITVAIECGSQGQVDQDHRVTVEVKAPDGTTKTIVEDVPAQTTSETVASGLAESINRAFELSDSAEASSDGGISKRCGKVDRVA